MKRTNSTFSEIALKMNWINHELYGDYGDGSRLRRALGMRPDQELDPSGNPKYRQNMQLNTAYQIIEAIDRAPWEFNI